MDSFANLKNPQGDARNVLFVMLCVCILLVKQDSSFSIPVYQFCWFYNVLTQWEIALNRYFLSPILCTGKQNNKFELRRKRQIKKENKNAGLFLATICVQLTNYIFLMRKSIETIYTRGPALVFFGMYCIS